MQPRDRLAMNRVSGFHHVALTVTDLDRSVAWYRDTLGFAEVFREAGDLRRACVMRFAGGGHGIGLVEHDPNDGAFSPRRTGLDHLAFSVADRDELERWAQQLGDAGVVHSGVVDVPPGAILNFKDPDGIALAFFWDRRA